MKKTGKILGLGLIGFLFLFGTVKAQDLDLSSSHTSATVYVIHGIPGLDLGLDPALSVDVWVNDAPAIQGFEFEDIAGPLSLPAGTYNIKIALAGTTDAVIEADVPFYEHELAVVIAHLTEEGGITASKFSYDKSPTPGHDARFYFHHLAAAPSVDASAYRVFGAQDPMFRVDDLSNGDKFMVEVSPKDWKFSLGPTGTGIELVSKKANLRKANGYLLYAVGSLEFQTFTFISLKIKGLR